MEMVHRAPVREQGSLTLPEVSPGEDSHRQRDSAGCHHKCRKGTPGHFHPKRGQDRSRRASKNVLISSYIAFEMTVCKLITSIQV